MKLTAATVYALQIPFVEGFVHSLSERNCSDSVVVKVEDERGNVGFGEGAARPYVTGETPEFVIDHIASHIWPVLARGPLPSVVDDGLGAIDAMIPEYQAPGVLADNASRCAVELAIIDLTLRRHLLPASALLPPRRDTVVYSGIIAAGSAEKAARHARQMRLAGLGQIKVKVGAGEDLARVRAVRETVGPDVSLRLDANGAWDLGQAVAMLNQMARLGIDAVEQPLHRGAPAELARLRCATPIPVMADESLVSLRDADSLIAARAVDYFNIRLSKCGGLARSLEMARRARAAGIKVQVGSHVGETAILSAAGRHLAAALDEVAFVEGSLGTLLLTADVTADGVRFGHRGAAALLRAPGLGVRVIEERLHRYAAGVWKLH